MYQWNASDYARHSQGQARWAQELLSGIELAEDERMLDVGCGDGRITAVLAQRAPRGLTVGVDLSADMIDHARRTFVGVKNLRFEQADASRLNFAAQFTLVFSNAALHWIRDHRPLLAGIARALQPGGRLVAQMGGAGNGATVIAAFNAVMRQPRWRDYFSGFVSTYGFHGVDDYREWLGDAGLVATTCKLIPKDMAHANVVELAAWLRTAWHPYTTPVPARLREAYIAATVDQYVLDNPADAHGHLHVPMMRLEVHAHKA